MLRIFGFYSFDKCNDDIIDRMIHLFELKSRFTKYTVFNQRNVFIDYEMVNSDESKRFYFVDLKFFTSPRFTGFLGTELFGYLPEWFIKGVNLNFVVVARKLFTHNFLPILYDSKERKPFANFKTVNNPSNYVHSFLIQIGRSYLNVHYNNGWERPTNFFSYLFLHPFADPKFVVLLCSLEYDKCMYYKLYQAIYERYYANFLSIPWTFVPFRKEKKFKGVFSKDERSKLNSQPKILTDIKFKTFLKNNHIIQKTKIALSSRIKEIYFLFKWFEAYKSVLGRSDIKFLSGKY